MTMRKLIIRLLTLMITQKYIEACGDAQFALYCDLCDHNLTNLNQHQIYLETISSKYMYISLCRNNVTNLEKDTFLIYRDLEKLVLSSNPNFQFPTDGSPMLTSSSLTDLVCVKCGIVEIFKGSLRELPSLEYLILSKNSISQIEKSALRKNQRLQVLDFSANMLRWIPSTLLTGLQEMKTLDLSFNRELAPVRQKPFLKNNALEILKCNGCGFTAIDGTTFARLTNLKEIHLQDNPVFQFKEPVSLSRFDLQIYSTHLLNHRLRSTVDSQLSEEETIHGKTQASKPAVVVIYYKH